MSTSMKAGRIEIRDLVLQYRNTATPAVDSINLTIEPGEFMTLLGPSGSGKTTTLNLLAGFLQPTAGDIRVNDQDLVAVPPNKRSFGMVFQDYALFPHMTVFDNVAFPLRQRKTAKSEIRDLVHDVLFRFGLAGFEARKPAELSGGQRQRVALARATVFSPSVLLLDEPLGALDRKLRHQLQAEIKKLHRELGLTFVFVTHDQDEAMFLSDKIAVFNKGRIERVGSPTQLYDDPGTQFVAEFLGEANVLDGTFTTDGGYEWHGRRVVASRPIVARDSLLIIRPENVLIGDESIATPERNAFPIAIVDVSHLGSSTRVDFRFVDGPYGTARLESGIGRMLSPGQAAWAAWHTDDQRFVTPDPDLLHRGGLDLEVELANVGGPLPKAAR
ncbi:ABC transporter ATP-binding protein [Microbacterium terregens]|uniref:ABC transporter ATP-binding protein n=1 Tax=Microbacterium terregens TaxID=69363 RepID=A0ABV5T7C1_9MICO